MIRKVKVKGVTKYRVVSHTTGRNLGTFGSKTAAQKRLGQVKRFKK